MQFTYTTLEAALLAYTEDQSAEYAANIPIIVKLGQDRVTRDLDLEIFKQVFTGSFTSGSNYVNKPDGLLSATSFYYVDSADNNRWKPLKPRTFDFCISYAGGEGVTGTPKYYDEGYSDTQIFVAYAPSSALPYRIRGLKRPDYISSTNAENWISKNAGDLLLYACLAGSEGFLMASQEGKTQEWETVYTRLLPQARIELASIARAEYAPQQSTEEARTE